jgi:glycosyltransferase involved in cell wall biosynthesis
MKNPLVSIIINCHNGEKYLKQCINSILNQTYKNFEIIFWDNNSDDESINIIKEFNDNRIKFFSSKIFTSLGEARNKAINESRGELVSFLDVDDWYVSEKIEKQVVEFSKDKSIGLVFTNYYYYNDFNKSKKLSISKIDQKNVTQEILDDYNIGIVTVMIKRALLKENNFRKDLNFIEDFDLIFRLSLITSFKHLNIPTAYYRTHENNLSKVKLGNYIDEFNVWSKIIKNDQKLEFNFKKFDSKLKLMDIKKDILMGERLKAIKKIITTPIYGKKLIKIKYLILILMPGILIKKLLQHSF